MYLLYGKSDGYLDCCRINPAKEVPHRSTVRSAVPPYGVLYRLQRLARDLFNPSRRTSFAVESVRLQMMHDGLHQIGNQQHERISVEDFTRDPFPLQPVRSVQNQRNNWPVVDWSLAPPSFARPSSVMDRLAGCGCITVGRMTVAMTRHPGRGSMKGPLAGETEWRCCEPSDRANRRGRDPGINLVLYDHYHFDPTVDFESPGSGFSGEWEKPVRIEDGWRIFPPTERYSAPRRVLYGTVRRYLRTLLRDFNFLCVSMSPRVMPLTAYVTTSSRTRPWTRPDRGSTRGGRPRGRAAYPIRSPTASSGKCGSGSRRAETPFSESFTSIGHPTVTVQQVPKYSTDSTEVQSACTPYIQDSQVSAIG